MGTWFSSLLAPKKQVTENHFDYATLPLDPARKEIRLIKLDLPVEDGPLVRTISCTIERFPLDQCPEYVPFSYVWGTGKKSPIRCNGARLDVLPNLYDALEQYRSSLMSEAWIWADAICINQGDDKEKSSQIRQMREIYQQGQRTWVWLGKADKRTDEAMSLLLTLSNVKDKQTQKGDERIYFQLSPQERKELDLPPPIFSSDYKSLSLLLSRAWFTRVWVIQELALSREAIVQCGPHSMPWQDLVGAVVYGHEMRIPMFTTPEPQRYLDEMESFRLMRQNGEQVKLLLLLMLSRSRRATEKKDKIYALCGLADDVGSDDLDIKPEYSKSVRVEDVYRETAENILRKSSSLDLLSVRRVTHNSKSQLPTWVPDWSVPDSWAGMFLPGAPEKSGYKHWATPAELRCAITFPEDGTICLSGHTVDRIEAISCKWTDERQLSTGSLSVLFKHIPREQAVLNDWENFCQFQANHEYTPTGERIFDVYWQTLIAGNLEGGFDDAKQRYEQYEQCYRSKFRRTPSLILRWLGFLAMIPPCIAFMRSLMKSQEDVWNQQESLAVFYLAMTAAKSRRMFRTSSGYIGLAPALAWKGDEVVLLQGGRVPLILRRVRKSEKWNLIGDCYVHGIMKGEGFAREKCHDILIC
jgi:Heterokaryon incompatibility protein (HET)